MPRIFISRTLKYREQFAALLDGIGHLEIQDESLLQFNSIPFSDPGPSDWIFFTSQHAVSFYLSGRKAFHIPSYPNTRWAALGPGTAQALRDQHFEPDFTGTGHPTATAQSFRTLASGKVVLFPAAVRSRESIRKIIAKTAARIIYLPVYENSPRLDFQILTSDLYIFTSPMNVEAFGGKYRLDKKTCIAIGESTMTALQKAGVEEAYLSPEPNEKQLAQLARQILARTNRF